MAMAGGFGNRRVTLPTIRIRGEDDTVLGNNMNLGDLLQKVTTDSMVTAIEMV